ncbi:hypothetical protein AVEN_143580-1 [Araneus ventricosus]|uniref:Uncharacterized protein n=1 Tax=Araneus ventricosus TaxID=182803 RepID=A0A4Y2AMY8_ARAVE|nr:hypothetical protein AVEN_143580-1 [Araneus ventricosus]
MIRKYWFLRTPRQTWGRSGLVVRSRPEGSKFETQLHYRSAVYAGLLHAKSYALGQTSSRWCDAEIWRKGVPAQVLSSSSENYEVSPKIALVLL